MSNRLVFIQILRRRSVLYIVGFGHLMNYMSVFPETTNQVTERLAVIILGSFVFLSDYLLAGKEIQLTFQSIKQFYLKRFLGIYLLYLFAIGLFLIANLSDVWALLKASLRSMGRHHLLFGSLP